MSLFLFFGQFLTAYFKFLMSRPSGSTNLMNFSNTHYLGGFSLSFHQLTTYLYFQIIKMLCTYGSRVYASEKVALITGLHTWIQGPHGVFIHKKVHLFAYQQHVQVHLFFVCLRFNSVVVKRIKNIHLFFLNPLMCFFLWSFRFSRFCPFQYILVIPNNCCLHHLPYPKGDKIDCLGQPYLRVCVKVKIIKKPIF